MLPLHGEKLNFWSAPGSKTEDNPKNKLKFCLPLTLRCMWLGSGHFFCVQIFQNQSGYNLDIPKKKKEPDLGWPCEQGHRHCCKIGRRG